MFRLLKYLFPDWVVEVWKEAMSRHRQRMDLLDQKMKQEGIV